MLIVEREYLSPHHSWRFVAFAPRLGAAAYAQLQQNGL